MNRILVADDQTDVRESLRILFRSEGFAMDVVNSPIAVLKAISSHHYDVLLLDMNYARDTTSGGEGLELLSRIRQQDDTLPVLLMTAWSTVGLAVQAMRIGACDFVEKPWDNAQLVSAVRRSIEAGRLRERKGKSATLTQRILSEMEDARATQQHLLPGEALQIEGIEVQAAWLPVGNVGGDYFDVIRLNDRALALCIGDVCGKGLPAALLMSNIQATVRAYARVDRSPSAMCTELNRAVCTNAQSGRFITLFYGLLDTAQNLMTYANAGHVPAILLGNDGCCTRLSDGGVGLGMFPNSVYEQNVVALSPGEHLILMTDGITEATNAAGQQFGDSSTLAACLSRNRRWTARQLKDALLDTVTSFTGELEDDATLLVVSRLHP